jgi:hypothetical protein
VIRRALIATAAALALAAPASAAWYPLTFSAAWPGSGRTSYRSVQLPPSTGTIAVTVNGARLGLRGYWTSLYCPTFASRASSATFMARYYASATVVTVMLHQGYLAWACLSGPRGGDPADVEVDYWR